MNRIILLFILTGIYSTSLFSQVLTVTCRTPNVNAQYVDASTNIEVVFDKNINAATVNENTFNVNGIYTGKIMGAYTVTNNTVTFNPDNDFYPGEVVTITITIGLQASDASVLAESVSWQFSVKSRTSSTSFNDQEVISTSANGAKSVFSVDLDSDGDMDVLSASWLNNKIAWYENDGGENFTAHTITTSASGALSVYSTDLDGDGDMDVLSASVTDSKIAWYENDGDENFTTHTITTSANGACSVFSTDLDGDGDMDILSASTANHDINWYENDGNENFTLHTIEGLAALASSVFSTDLDSDGDMDVLSASAGDNKINWYENDGNKNFATHNITTSADGASSVFSTDLDCDGDMDVLSASAGDNKINWYENDGNENFATHNITTSADGASSVFSTDLDGDGDIDVLSASARDNKIAWYENDGNENFTTHNITTSVDGACSVFCVDLDGDGDMDVLSASEDEDKIAWHGNKSLGTSNSFTKSCKKNNDIIYDVSFFPYQEEVQSNPITGIQVVDLPHKGYLYFDDNSDGNADISELLVPDDIFTCAELDENKLKFKPFTDEYGTAYTTFIFKVENKDGLSTDKYTTTIDVKDVQSDNVAPYLTTNSGAALSEGGTFTLSDAVLKASDPDGPTYSLAYNITRSPKHGTIGVNGALLKGNTVTTNSFTQNDVANGKVTYTHNGDEVETDVFRFTVSDTEGGTSPEYNFDITIVGTNEPPVIDSLPSIRFNEDEEYWLDLKTWYEFVNDVDTPDSSLFFSFSCSNNCIHFSEIENNTCTISADDNYFGSDSILVTVSDGEFNCSCHVEILIEGVNDLPVINGLPSSITITNGDVEDINIWNNVEDVETPDSSLRISFITTPDSLYKYYDPETGMLSVAAMSSFDGEVELTIFVIDEDNGVTSEIINFVIEEYIDPNPTGTKDKNGIPNEIQLSQNYPNPFNPSTTIRYAIPTVLDANFASTTNVTLRVYDILGNEVVTLVNEQQSPGYYERTWHASNVSSGIYFYVLRVGSFVESRKMILLK